MTPDGTPREAWYIETGLLDIETLADSKRLNMKARLNRDKSELMQKVLSNPDCMWEKDTSDVMNKVGIRDEDLIGSKFHTKNAVKRAITSHLKTNMEHKSQGKSKMTYMLEHKEAWKVGVRPRYMEELTRKQTSLIFRARSRMIKVKVNYKKGHPELMCRMCYLDSHKVIMGRDQSR